MLYKFSTISCRSGYNGEKQDQRATFHSFPLENKQTFQTWLRRLARKVIRIPTKHSKLCSFYFKFEDFFTDSTDQKTWRKRKRVTSSLIRR